MAHLAPLHSFLGESAESRWLRGNVGYAEQFFFLCGSKYFLCGLRGSKSFCWDQVLFQILRIFLRQSGLLYLLHYFPFG